MVEFTNIRVEGDWIFADAYDRDYKVFGHIKVHKFEELFETDFNGECNFKKAAWALQYKVEKKKVKSGCCTIAWG